MIEMLYAVNWFILWYLIITSIGYIVLLAASIPDVMLRFKEEEVGNIITMLRTHSLPPITIITPFYNEKEILDSVYSILNSSYSNMNLLLVNDGSTDATLKKLIQAFDMHKVAPIIPERIKTWGAIKGYYVSKKFPYLTVIDKEHTNTGDTLNVGVNACRTPLFATVDADTLLEPDAISRVVFHLLIKPHTVAVGGAVYVLNGCEYKEGKMIEAKMSRKMLYSLQACEYLRSFLLSRAGWNMFGGSLSYSGAFTLFEHKAVVDVKGFDLNNTAQDLEIIAHLRAHGYEHDYPYHVLYTPAATAWTDVPGTLKDYIHQRYIWQTGVLKSLMKHKRMFFNPKYGIVGLLNYPFFLLVEEFGSTVELMAYLSLFASWYLGILDMYWVMLLFVICIGLVTFLTMATAVISFITFNKYKKLKDLVWLLFLVMVESLGFRQISVLVRCFATCRFFIGKLKFWH